MRSIVFLFLASFALYAFADDEGQEEEWHRPPHPKRSSILTGQYMTGNWDGWRDVLEEHGILFGSFFITEQIRAAIEYAHFQTHYVDGVYGYNDRVQVTTWFVF